jgi:hypothetical protein
MTRHITVVLVLLCGAARASGFDDAAQALHEAQRLSDDGGACKALSTKLKLANEALDDARKSKAAGKIRQAKGRVETARDAATTGCNDAARPKVTEALNAAIAALDKAAEPAPVENKGAPFETACTANDQCASDSCFVGASGSGYCSKLCASASDCPPKWACRRPGSEAKTICIK